MILRHPETGVYPKIILNNNHTKLIGTIKVLLK